MSDCPYVHNEKCNRGCRGFQCRHRDAKRQEATVAALADQERQLIAIIEHLKRCQDKAIEPYVQQLVRIQSLRAPAPVYVSKTEPHPDVAPFEGPLG